MSALRPVVRPRRFWIIIAAALLLGGAAVIDWTRPPRQQVSVYLYERAVVGGYRAVLQPLIGGIVRCRFRPSCSRYSVDVMHGHGFPRGAWLTLTRIVRCRPSVPFGTRDEAPEPAR